MEMQIHKVGLFRPANNPKSCKLNVNLDWNIHYTYISKKSIGYIFQAKGDNIPLNFQIEGEICFKSSEIPEGLSHLILHYSLEIMLKIFNITKEIPLESQDIPTLGEFNELQI
ncbi:MAG: hypothetical protein H5T36_01460 [Methanobacteriaceae archaeon]|nr:hypothetical protein [Methanobacteriaceae archaeon]